MKRGETSRECPADASKYFKEAIVAMRHHGITEFRKMAFRLETDDKPVLIRSPSVPLSEGELIEPEFWMPTGYDGEAEKIAVAGQEWANRVLRPEDMQIYVLRVLLEYARVTNDNREKMGWVGDLL